MKTKTDFTDSKQPLTLEPARWVDRYADVLFSLALMQVKVAVVAEDIVQETFVAGLAAMSQFKGEAQERTWLMAILRHKINDYFRQQTRRPTVLLDDHFYDHYFDRDQDGELDHWLATTSPGDWGVGETPDESDALNAVLYACLDKLPPRHAQMVTLKFLDDTKPADICREMGITASNYWTLLHRIKILLRDCLEKNWYSLR